MPGATILGPGGGARTNGRCLQSVSQSVRKVVENCGPRETGHSISDSTTHGPRYLRGHGIGNFAIRRRILCWVVRRRTPPPLAAPIIFVALSDVDKDFLSGVRGLGFRVPSQSGDHLENNLAIFWLHTRYESRKQKHKKSLLCFFTHRLFLCRIL
jgi:hypothetical protein